MTHPFASEHYQKMAQEARQLVRQWVNESQSIKPTFAAEQLAGVLKDPNGLPFTVGFVDGVIRPEDDNVSGRNLSRIAGLAPSFLPWYMKSAVGFGGKLAGKVAWPTVPVARRVLREMVGHLIVDASEEKLGDAIAELTKSGNRLNVNLLGEAVLGDKEAEHRLSETKRLLARDDVDYVSIKVSAVSGPHQHWAFDEVVETAVRRLTPLYELAASSSPKKFINLDMEEYKDLDLTIEVFTKILDQPHLKDLEAGIVLQAYLPDTLGAMQRLQAWAAKRVEAGGAGVKVRLVKGANLSMEIVEAVMHGWPLTTWDTKQAADTNYKRVLDYALRPEHVKNIRLGIAGHNLFDVAFALLLSEDRGVKDRVEFEMLIGMAEQQAEIDPPPRGSPAAVRARREPQGIRRCYRIPDSSSRGERLLRELHVRYLRPGNRRVHLQARRGPLHACTELRHRRGSRIQAHPEPSDRGRGQRLRAGWPLREHPRHRPCTGR